MRVGFDHSIFSLQQYGGISRYFLELIRNLQQMSGVEPHITAPLYLSQELRLADDLSYTGIYCPQIKKTHTIRQAINNMVSTPLLKRLQPDIIHQTYYTARCSYPDTAVKIITVFDMIHERFGTIMPQEEAIIPSLKKRCVLAADHVICISEQTRRDLVELLGVAEAKTTVIYLGSSIQGGMEDKPEAVVDAPYLLYVGNRAGPKNFKNLLLAYLRSRRLVQDFDLICFGPDFTPEELQILQELHVRPESVRQIGGDDTLLAGLYSHAAALVYPSLYEGFGLPIIEAMTCGCPVLTSQVSSMPEIAGDAAAYFSPTEPEAISTAIENLVYAPLEREKLITAGRERVKQFSWTQCARQTLSVYEQCLQRQIQ